MVSIFNSSGPASLSLEKALKNGALIVDVRAPEEFAAGHVPGSVNIPLSSFSRSLSELRKQKAIVLCCRSCARSGSAKALLEAVDFVHVVNGGSWQNVSNHL